jgi:hypothetical protein
MSLPPLEEAALTQLLESIAGHLDTTVLHKLCKLSEGSPFAATAILKGIVETGALRFERNAWVSQVADRTAIPIGLPHSNSRTCRRLLRCACRRARFSGAPSR